MEAVNPNHEIGNAVAIHVPRNVGVSFELIVSQLSGNTRKNIRLNEDEGLVSINQAIGVYYSKVDAIAFRVSEVRDDVRVRRRVASKVAFAENKSV